MTLQRYPSQVKLDLMPRADFAALSLHDKNTYLHELARRFADQTGRTYRELSKEGLSRLRRYYSRRIWADLKVDSFSGELGDALRRLGEAIRDNEQSTDIAAALMQEMPPARSVMRPPPIDDAQLMFFVPSIYDAPIKDDVNLMDVAPFSLSKKPREGVLRYELKDCLITIEGGAEAGLATVFDYDIFLNMVSYLAEEVKRFRSDEAKGLRPSLPAKVYRPSAAHILKFCRRSDGGRQYDEIEEALRRLVKTSITITNLTGGKRRQVDTRPLIGEYRVVSTTNTGKVDEIEITIPDWVYSSVVRADKVLPLLTLNPDYFLISSGIGRFIYRLARKAAGRTTAYYTVADLHERSGSKQELRFFVRDLKDFVARTQSFPDYELALSKGKDGLILSMKRRDDGTLPDADLPLLPNVT
jgi:plasmid replication initiation protein